DEDSEKRIATHGLILVFIFGLAVALIGMSFHDSIFRAMGAHEELLPLIRDYMMIWFAGAVFVTLPLVGNAALRAAGDTFTPSLIMTVVAVVNLILDPIMIFGLFGFPRLEIVGAALSTVLANAAAMVAGLYVLGVRRKMLLPLNDLHLDKFGDSTRRLLFIALPAGLTNAIQPIVSGFILYLLAGYGPEAVAAFGVAGRIEAFAFIILMAVSVGMAPIIGQNWGAGKHDRVQETLKLAIGFNVIWSLLVAIILGLFAGPIAGVFSDDPLVVQTTKTFFWIVPLSYVFGNLIQGWASAFNAIGKPQRAFAMIAIKMIVMLIPAVVIGEHLAGVAGIFWGIAVVNVISGIAFHIYSARACKQKS
ncbi:MAG TPA: MATE family efflux transporter, partial [Alphaproteobacteria bacterium]|nr:MATE family efflux transporter [Alphaproteobacteria bacterium]